MMLRKHFSLAIGYEYVVETCVSFEPEIEFMSLGKEGKSTDFSRSLHAKNHTFRQGPTPPHFLISAGVSSWR